MQATSKNLEDGQSIPSPLIPPMSLSGTPTKYLDFLSTSIGVETGEKVGRWDTRYGQLEK